MDGDTSTEQQPAPEPDDSEDGDFTDEVEFGYLPADVPEQAPPADQPQDDVDVDEESE